MSEKLQLIPVPVQAPAQHPLLEGLERFLRLAVAEGSASPETLRSYRTSAQDFIAHMGSPEAAAAATLDDIEGYRAALLAQGKGRGTVGTRLAGVRAMFRAAQRWGMRPDDPAAGVKAPAQRTAVEDRTKFLPIEGARLIMGLPDRTEPCGRRDIAMLGLMLGHGLRVSEVAGLNVSDLVGTELRVLGKGQKVRRLMLTVESITLLKAWLGDRADLAYPGEEAMFIALDRGHSGRRISDRAIRYMVDALIERAGLKKDGLSCHSLRHAFAVFSLQGGARLEHLRDAMGHSSVRTTEVYARIVDRAKNNPAAFMWGALA